MEKQDKLKKFLNGGTHKKEKETFTKRSLLHLTEKSKKPRKRKKIHISPYKKILKDRFPLDQSINFFFFFYHFFKKGKTIIKVAKKKFKLRTHKPNCSEPSTSISMTELRQQKSPPFCRQKGTDVKECIIRIRYYFSTCRILGF